MFITDFSIKRPVFSISVCLMILMVGILSYKNLDVQQYPSVDEPILSVETGYAGAAPHIVESNVTATLENTLASTPNLDYMTSSSTTGRSSITLYFRGGTSLSEAASDVREKIAQTSNDLPEECSAPVVNKSDSDFVMNLILTSSTHSDTDLYAFADNNLKSVFAALPGVGGVEIYGNPETMQLRFDREKLKAYNLSIMDVLDIIKKNNKELPAGNIIKGKRHINIVVEGAVNTPRQMEEVILMTTHGHTLRLKDVATVTLGKDMGGNLWVPRFNKKPAVFMNIKKASNGNVLAIAATVLKHLAQIQSSIPADIHIEEGYNVAVFVQAAIQAVGVTIGEAIFLVLLIILFFLHSPRAALIPLITIPVSLIGGFCFLYAFDCSINTITLLAMVLAVGLVVDDAIVVLENIYRHIEKGLSPREAAFQGSREVGFVIIAMTATLASVYAPIAFVQGLTGKLFAEFAVTLGGAVLISGVVALILSPMMCAHLLPPQGAHKKNKLIQWIERFLIGIDRVYAKALKEALEHPRMIVSVLILVLGGDIVLLRSLPSELAPQEDEGIIQASIQGAQGTTVEAMLVYTPQIEDLLASVPEHFGLWTATQRSGIGGGVTLVPWKKRSRSQADVINDLRKQSNKMAGVQVFFYPLSSILTGGQGDFQMAVKTMGSYGELEVEMDKLVTKLKKYPCFQSVSQDLSLSTPQLNIQIDRDKAALLGITIEDAARTLEVMLSGDRNLTFEKEGQDYELVIQSREEHTKDLRDIGNFYIKPTESEGLGSENPALVPLHTIATLREVAVSSNMQHLSKMRSATLSIDLAPSCSIDEALRIVEVTAKETLPKTFQLEPIGNLRKFLESQGEMLMMFMASLLFIYLVLAIQFESFLDPLLIMVTVPLSLVGALLALYLSGGTLNIFSQVGLITLVGLITKHGILLVEFANKRRAEGLSVREAALQAATLRLRPIVMTTGAMVLGALPLALATGAGAMSRQQIGWVLVGGLLGGTLFTLFAVPFVYIGVKSGFARFQMKQRGF